jgi:hypothetical protein
MSDLASVVPLPCNWDEILDWTADATDRSSAITVSCQRGCYSRFETLVAVRITPLVNPSAQQTEIDKLSSKSYLDRALFYSESVCEPSPNKRLPAYGVFMD